MKGGFASVYEDPRDAKMCIKKFLKPLTGEEAQRLLRLVEVPNWSRPSDRSILLNRFSWPIDTFGTPDQILGFSMQKAPPDAYFSLTVARKTQHQLLALSYLMDDSYWKGAAVESAKPSLDDQDRLEMAIDLLDALETIHRIGLVYGDVSSNNLCGRLGETPSVFLLDADSIVTPEVRAKNMVRTPGWVVPESLDPISTDRSLISLFIWRFMLEEPSSYPDSNRISLLKNRSVYYYADLLVNGYKGGDENDLIELAVRLRLARDIDRDARALRRASDTKFARFVVHEAAEARTDSERKLVANAHAHIAYEKSIETASPARQRLLINRATHHAGEFQLDLSPSLTSSTPPTTISELHQMISDARECELAIHLAASGLGLLEGDRWLDRAMKHALIEAGQVEISSVVKVENAVISWTWPPALYVNHAELTIHLDSGKLLSQIIARDKKTEQTERTLHLPGGGPIAIELLLGVKSPNDSSFFGTNVITHDLVVPSPPKPVMQRPSLAVGNSVGPAIIDLEEQERLRVLADKARRRQAKHRVLVAAATIGLIGGSVTAWALTRYEAIAEQNCRQIGITELGPCSFESAGYITGSDFYLTVSFDTLRTNQKSETNGGSG